jgi:hypothetical protein
MLTSTDHGQTQTFPLSEGDTGTAQTIAQMRSVIDRYVKNQDVNRTAIALAWNSPQFSQAPKAQAIFTWISQNFRFVGNIVGKQTLRTPIETIQVRGGSCADFTVLIATLLGTIGIKSRAVTISSHSDDPQSFSHVYPEAFVDGQWVAMDVARPGAQFGRTPEVYYRKREWNLFGSGFKDVSGLSGYLGCACPHQAGRFGGRALGQGDVTWESILTPQLVSSVTQGTANIINATNGVVTYPAGTYAVAPAPVGVASISPVLLLVLLGVGLLAMAG